MKAIFMFLSMPTVASALALATAACSGDDTTPSTAPAPDASSSDSSTADGAAGDSAAPDGGTADSTAADSGSSGDDSATPSNGASPDSGADSAPNLGDSGTTLSFTTDVYTPIIGVVCAGCHGSAADGGAGPGLAFGKLNLGSESEAYASLVGDGGGVPAAGSRCVATGVLRVVPGNPTASLLYNKVISNIGDGGPVILDDGGPLIFCGSPMPLHGPALGTADLATIHDWIQQGANP